MYPTIISYYTQDTAYEIQAKRLIASCEKFKLPYSIDPIPNLGTWERNCCYKPKYILQKLTDLNKPVLWIDADAEFVQKPTLFEDFSPDIALRIVETVPDTHPSKMISGTIYLNPTAAAFEILKAWDIECDYLLQTEPHVWDQIALRNVLLTSQANIYGLPKSYYMVYDKREEGEEAFILHYQASRTEKKVINQEVIPFWVQ
ncbi:MAG: hypothetical protein KDK69_05130 [Chlamydiia bacterium]|nr:hypothetical protein [Chlamydiia bacterium]